MLRLIQSLMDTSHYKPHFLFQGLYHSSVSGNLFLTHKHIFLRFFLLHSLSELFHVPPRKLSSPYVMMDQIMKAEKCHVLVKL